MLALFLMFRQFKHAANLIIIFTLAFSVNAALISLLIPPQVYSQTTNAWNLQRSGAGNDLNIYYNNGSNQPTALQLNTNGEAKARRILDLDDSNYYLNPNSTSNLSSLTLGQIPRVGGAAYLTVGDLFTQLGATNAGWRVVPWTDHNVYQDTKVGTNGYIQYRTGAGTESGATRAWMTVLGASGNVGLNTNAPTSKLVVRSADNTNTTNIFETLANNETIGIALGYDAIRMGGSAVNSNLSVSAKGTGNLLLQADASGNAGIGITTPAYKLDVNGNARLGSSTAGGIRVYTGGALSGIILPAVANGNIRITDDSTAATRGITIANGGALGVRTGSPISDVHIKQISNSQYSGGITLERADTTNQGAVFIGADNKLYFMSGAGYLTVATNSRLDVKGDARIDYKLAVNGYEPGACQANFGLCVGGSSGGQSAWTNTSDIRLKKNIQPISNALDKIMSLKGVYFDFIETDQGVYKTLPKGRQLGYIAQEVEKILPEVVVTGGDGMKMMSYANITALLSEGIKQQQHELESQRKIIDKQEEMIKSLEKSLSDLSEEVKALKQ